MKMHSFSHYSQEIGHVVHDAWISTKVKSVLAMDKATRGQHIGVRTHAGVVTLSGRLASHRQCEQAVALVRSLQGVGTVNAEDLEPHVFAPGGMPAAPNAEEVREPQAAPSKQDENQS